jgi:hypothetical protein
MKKAKSGTKKAESGMNPAVYWSIRGGILVGLIVIAVVLWGMFQDRQRQNRETEQENARISKRNAEVEAQEANRDQPKKTGTP